MTVVESRYSDALRRIYQADSSLRSEGKGPEKFIFIQTFGGDSVKHPCWDSSWATPSEETLMDLTELELLRVQRRSNALFFSLSMKGREKAAVLSPHEESALNSPEDESGSRPDRDSRKVAVMHGRDSEARAWMFDWLRRVGLEPLEWSELVELTGKAAPYNGEAVEAAFSEAQAVVVLLTPDEMGALHPDLRGSEDQFDPTGQARLNVILEAGMALQSHPKETVLVEIGRTREISDLAGRNAIRLSGDPAKLNDLANRLEAAGCAVRRTGEDWLDTHGLKALAALRREAVRSRPRGGIAAIGIEGSPYCVVRMRERILEYRLRNEDGWSGWSQIGTLPTEGLALAASSLDSGHAEVFILLPSGEVFHTWWLHDSGWHSGFLSLGKPFGDKPAAWITAASTEKGHQEVFVGAADGEIANIWHLHGRWHPNNMPGTSYGDGWSRF
jgi:predicted nucleotide-binding protein